MTSNRATTLVTGFGVYDSKSNTAGMIARILPSLFAADHALNSSHKDITILDPHADYAVMPAQLGATRQRVKQLHEEHGAKVDLWIHLGQWDQDFVTCERRAFRQDFSSTWNRHTPDKHYYMTPDNLGQVIDDVGPNPWLEVPMGLHSEVPVDDTVSGANKVLEQVTGAAPLVVRSHIEAGGQGCGFIFYESMANCHVDKRRRDVLFLHVPPYTEQAALEKTRDAVLAIIGAAIAALAERDSKPETAAEKRRLFVMTP